MFHTPPSFPRTLGAILICPPLPPGLRCSLSECAVVSCLIAASPSHRQPSSYRSTRRSVSVLLLPLFTRATSWIADAACKTWYPCPPRHDMARQRLSSLDGHIVRGKHRRLSLTFFRELVHWQFSPSAVAGLRNHSGICKSTETPPVSAIWDYQGSRRREKPQALCSPTKWRPLRSLHDSLAQRGFITVCHCLSYSARAPH